MYGRLTTSGFSPASHDQQNSEMEGRRSQLRLAPDVLTFDARPEEALFGALGPNGSLPSSASIARRSVEIIPSTGELVLSGM